MKKTEGKLLELKAKVESLNTIREKLRDLKARHVGTFKQIDTYFNVPKGRLKLRQIEGKEEAELIYYERENILGPKRSNVFIIEIQEPEIFKILFEKMLDKRVVIEKKREIYRYRGTRIHLDTVKNLGTFIEFERKTKDLPEETRKDRKILEELMKALEIENKNLLKGSYSDIASELFEGGNHLIHENP